MSITVNIYYTGKDNSAVEFAREMEQSGTAELIRREKGNRRYEYFLPMNGTETVLLIDSWEDQASIDAHHASPMMKTIAQLREKYDLHMRVEKYVPAPEEKQDREFIRE